MAKFGTFQYGSQLYGRVDRGSASSEILARPLDYQSVSVTVYCEPRVGSRYSLVRTTTGAAEEPGVGLTVAEGVIQDSVVSVVDDGQQTASGSTIGLRPGPHYYTFFVYDSSGNWLKDAATSTLVPEDKGTQEVLMRMLPRVFTTANEDPVDEPDMSGDLARFLYPMAVTFDQLQTFVDQELPGSARSRTTLRGLHDAHCRSLGMPVEFTVGSAASTRLFRGAGYIYREKGTATALEHYAEALTGWPTTVKESSNRLLSLDDASFETGKGNWEGIGVVIQQVAYGSVAVNPPDTDYDYLLAPFASEGLAELTLEYDGLVEIRTPTSPVYPLNEFSTNRLSSLNTRAKSISVNAGASLYIAGDFLTTSGTPTVRANVYWLRADGYPASPGYTLGTEVTLDGTWTRYSDTLTVPDGVAYAQVGFAFSGAGGEVIYADRLQASDEETHYEDPATVDVICAPSRMNLMTRPSFEAGNTWSAETGTVDLTTDEYFYGSYSIAASGSTDFSVVSEEIPVVVGDIMSAGAQIKSAEPAALAMVFYDSDGAEVVSEYDGVDEVLTSMSQPSETSGSGDWEQALIQYRVPDGATVMRLRITGTGDAWIDAVIADRANRALQYFDISIADSGGEDSIGVVDGSHVYAALYANRLTKYARLRDTAEYYLPAGVRARVLLWDSDDPHVAALRPYLR